MKKTTILTGTIMVGFSLYLLFYQYQLSLFSGFYSWPTLFVLIGIGFLADGFIGKNVASILPGTLFAGIGIHFHIAHYFAINGNNIGIFLLLIAIGLLLSYIKSGQGLVQGILFLITAILLLFMDKLRSLHIFHEALIAKTEALWPFILLAVGVYLLFFNRKKH